MKIEALKITWSPELPEYEQDAILLFFAKQTDLLCVKYNGVYPDESEQNMPTIIIRTPDDNDDLGAALRFNTEPVLKNTEIKVIEVEASFTVSEVITTNFLNCIF